LLGLGDGGTPPPVEFAKPVEIRRIAARCQAGGNLFEVAAEMWEVVHSLNATA